MATQKTTPVTGDVKDAEAAKDAAVLDGVTETTGSTPAKRGRRPAANAAGKPAPAKANGGKPAPAKANGDKPSTGSAPATDKAPSYRRYATAEAPAAMVGFSKWISREFKDVFPDGVDPRLVTIASKAYRYYQASDLNK